MAKQNNFKLLKLKSLEKVANYESSQSLTNYISGWLPCFLNFEDSTTQDRLLDEIIDSAKSNYSGNNGAIQIPYTVLQFILQK